MSLLMKVEGFADGGPCPIAGQYLASFDFDAFDGIGHGIFTAYREKAKRFASAGDLLAFWKTQSTVRPYRDDGKPNRPLTATTVSTEVYETPVPSTR